MKRVANFLRDSSIPLLLLIGALLLRIEDPLFLRQARDLVFDQYQRWQPRAFAPDLPVVIADIEERSLEKFGQWPWRRSDLARIVARLQDLGAAIVALDIILAEKDRTGPGALLADLPPAGDLAALREGLARLPDPDAELAAVLGRGASVVAFALQDRDPRRAPIALERKTDFAVIGKTDMAPDWSFLPSAPYLIAALPEFQKAAAGIGAVNTGNLDADNIQRRVPLLLGFDGQIWPSLAAEALRLGLGGQTPRLRLASADGLSAIALGDRIVPVTAKGEILLYDTGHRQERFVSVADLMAPDFPAERIAGKLVFLGASAEALQDLRATPLSPAMPGVEIHAQIAEQVLSGAYLLRPDWTEGAELAFLAGLGLAFIALARGRRALIGLGLAGIAIGGAIAVSAALFARQGFLLDPLYPAFTAFLIFVAAMLVNFLRTEREKRQVRGAFQRYLSPVLVDQLARHPERLKLGGELRDLTLMFCDIRGFTKLSEGLDPGELTHVINAFLTPMTKVIQDHGGTIDKYIGDCIMAFWNAPLPVEHHGRAAIAAALAMRRKLQDLNADFAAAAPAGRPPIHLAIGIGLNSGRVCVGNMGSEQRFDYSVLGDTVNIASRLEALSPAYRVDLVIGEATAAMAPDLPLLELDLVRVKGKALPIRIFTALDETPGDFARLAALQGEMLAAYRRQDWAAAETALTQALAIAPERLSGFYGLYGERIAAYRQDPPPPDWDGVYVARSKSG